MQTNLNEKMFKVLTIKYRVIITFLTKRGYILNHIKNVWKLLILLQQTEETPLSTLQNVLKIVMPQHDKKLFSHSDNTGGNIRICNCILKDN